MLAVYGSEGVEVEETVETIESLQAQIKSLNERMDQAEQAKLLDNEKAAKKAFYAPDVFGAILAFYGVSGYDGDQRFAIRNAHLGVKGNASSSVSYQIQVNFHNLGSVSVLDSWIKYKSGRFDATLGQQFIHMTADFDRCGPKISIFNTRSYGVLFIPAYTNGTTLKTLGNRDIGLYTNYTLGCDLPITLSLAAFNGAGSNQVSWDDDINLMGRIQIGGAKGLSGGGSYYFGGTPYNQKIAIYSVEARYITDNLFVEANYQVRRLRDSDDSPYDNVSTGLIEGYYTFKLDNCKVFESLAPCLRYDFGRNVDYSNTITETIEKLDVSRITAQMMFSFAGQKIRSRFTVGYEKKMMAEKPSDIGSNTLFQDLFIVGATVAF
ncbi:MAG: porin [Rikenellaceae bacterium]